MITIINERNGKKTNFKNYKKLYSHIEHHQRSKKHNKPIDDWVFARHSYYRAMAFYDFICMQKEKAKENPRWESQRFDVLEMSYDKSVKPAIIPIMPNADVDPHLEDWCKRYCQSHGFRLVEVEDDDGVLHVKRDPACLFNLEITEAHLWWKG